MHQNIRDIPPEFTKDERAPLHNNQERADARKGEEVLSNIFLIEVDAIRELNALSSSWPESWAVKPLPSKFSGRAKGCFMIECTKNCEHVVPMTLKAKRKELHELVPGDRVRITDRSQSNFDELHGSMEGVIIENNKKNKSMVINFSECASTEPWTIATRLDIGYRHLEYLKSAPGAGVTNLLASVQKELVPLYNALHDKCLNSKSPELAPALSLHATVAELDLSSCDIKDADAEQLGSSLLKLPNLQKVNFRNNSELFTKHGCAKLSRALGSKGHAGVVEINLENLQIQACAAEQLGLLLLKFRNLRKVNIKGNQELFDPDTVAKLCAGRHSWLKEDIELEVRLLDWLKEDPNEVAENL